MNPQIPPVLMPLVRYLENLEGAAPLDHLRQSLSDLCVTGEDVRDFLNFHSEHYTHNVIAVGQWYLLVVLCWRSGQRSPIHSHAGTSCVFKVLTGVCSETVYKTSLVGQIFPLLTQQNPLGVVVARIDSDIYQLSNLQAANQDLVMLHIYTPPPSAFQTVSIVDTVVTDPISGRVLDQLAVVRNSTTTAGRSLNDEILDKVLVLMRQRMRHELHRDDFSRLTGHSNAHFSFLFKNRTGQSLYRYFKEFRLREAHKMIVAGESDLEKVALAVGYSNLRHFRTIFRKFWKYLPEDLVSRMRKPPSDRGT